MDPVRIANLRKPPNCTKAKFTPEIVLILGWASRGRKGARKKIWTWDGRILEAIPLTDDIRDQIDTTQFQLFADEAAAAEELALMLSLLEHDECRPSTEEFSRQSVLVGDKWYSRSLFQGQGTKYIGLVERDRGSSLSKQRVAGYDELSMACHNHAKDPLDEGRAVGTHGKVYAIPEDPESVVKIINWAEAEKLLERKRERHERVLARLEGRAELEQKVSALEVDEFFRQEQLLLKRECAAMKIAEKYNFLPRCRAPQTRTCLVMEKMSGSVSPADMMDPVIVERLIQIQVWSSQLKINASDMTLNNYMKHHGVLMRVDASMMAPMSIFTFEHQIALWRHNLWFYRREERRMPYEAMGSVLDYNLLYLFLAVQHDLMEEPKKFIERGETMNILVSGIEHRVEVVAGDVKDTLEEFRKQMWKAVGPHEELRVTGRHNLRRITWDQSEFDELFSLLENLSRHRVMIKREGRRRGFAHVVGRRERQLFCDESLVDMMDWKTSTSEIWTANFDLHTTDAHFLSLKLGVAWAFWNWGFFSYILSEYTHIASDDSQFHSMQVEFLESVQGSPIQDIQKFLHDHGLELETVSRAMSAVFASLRTPVPPS